MLLILHKLFKNKISQRFVEFLQRFVILLQIVTKLYGPLDDRKQSVDSSGKVLAELESLKSEPHTEVTEKTKAVTAPPSNWIVDAVWKTPGNKNLLIHNSLGCAACSVETIRRPN